MPYNLVYALSPLKAQVLRMVGIPSMLPEEQRLDQSAPITLSLHPDR
jgi:hypothetical protein